MSSGQVRRDSNLCLINGVDLNLISPVRSHSTDQLTSEYPLMSLQCTLVFYVAGDERSRKVTKKN